MTSMLAITIVSWAFHTYEVVVLIRCVLSFLRTPQYGSPWIPVWNFFYAVTEPLLKPIRSLLKRSMTGRIDFSPLILMLLLQVLRSLIIAVLVRNSM